MIELFHVSDLHFGAKKVSKDFLNRLGKAFIIAKNENKYLLVTGDITNDGKKGQFGSAGNALGPFSEFVRAVPGNHDYASLGFIYKVKKAKDFDNIFLPSIKIKHKYFSKKPFCEILDDGKDTKVLLLGLNSCTQTKDWLDIAKGEIGDSQLAILKGELDKPEYKTIPKIIFLHHIPHKRARGIGMSLRDYKKLMDIIKDKVQILAFGHQGDMKEVKDEEVKKLPQSEKDKVEAVRKQNIPIREMRIRSGKRQNIKYYLDANRSADNGTCYHIKIDKDRVSAKLEKIT